MVSSIPVALYVPNLLGYARILLAFYGLWVSGTSPVLAITVWNISAILDLFDGWTARLLCQTSSLGVLLDIAADNILRTCGWIGAAAASGGQPVYLVTAAAVITIEWVTMVATQLHAARSAKHWKSERDKDPWLVRALFANNFRNPLGVFIMFGMFTTSWWCYGNYHPILCDAIPWYNGFQYVAMCGRALSLCIELWMCKSYLGLVILQDSKKAETKEMQ